MVKIPLIGAKVGLGTGLAIGAGVALLFPQVRRALRPAAKKAVEAGIAIVEKGRVVAEEGRQAWNQLADEARADLAARRAARAAAEAAEKQDKPE